MECTCNDDVSGAAAPEIHPTPPTHGTWHMDMVHNSHLGSMVRSSSYFWEKILPPETAPVVKPLARWINGRDNR